MAEEAKEQQSSNNPNYRAGELGGDSRVAVHPQRRYRIIAAIIRDDPRFLNDQNVQLTEEERLAYGRRARREGGRGIDRSDLRNALRQVQIPVRSDDEGGIQDLYHHFEGESDEIARRRRIVGLLARGHMSAGGEVE